MPGPQVTGPLAMEAQSGISKMQWEILKLAVLLLNCINLLLENRLLPKKAELINKIVESPVNLANPVTVLVFKKKVQLINLTATLPHS